MAACPQGIRDLRLRSRIGAIALLLLACWIALGAAGPTWNGTMAGPLAALGTHFGIAPADHRGPHGHDQGHDHDHDHHDMADADTPEGHATDGHDHGPLDHLHDAVMTARVAQGRQPARGPPLRPAVGLPPASPAGLERPPRQRA